MVLNVTHFPEGREPVIDVMEVETFHRADVYIQSLWEASNVATDYLIRQSKDGVRRWQLLKGDYVLLELKYTTF